MKEEFDSTAVIYSIGHLRRGRHNCKACPVMVNGESTEDIECAGYGRVRNIDEARIRGGVLLVIGEGLCLKRQKFRGIPRD